ncbi:J domain-containing protein [bacterium]|nr:J domain-containing protein [bacterium]
MKKDYYKILGIPYNAKIEDVKKAYRRLVHSCHPDIAGNTPEIIEKFKEITEAYETLSSPQKREQYDSIMKLYKYADNETQEKPKKTKEAKKEEPKEEQEPVKPKKENTFSKMREQAKTVHNKNIFSDFIKGLIKNSKPKQKKYTPPKIDGKDITTHVTLSLEEAINGTDRIVNILHMETCEKCKGRKFINGSVCPSCGGAGEKSKYNKLTVKIPPKVKQGSKIRVEGEGNKGYNGGKRGDLFLVINIENAQDIQYDGLDIIRTIPIAPYEAVLGGFISFEMNGETIKMKLMPMTYSGQKYRISEQGLEKDGIKGDLIVTIKIDLPKKLSKEEIELYERLKAISKRSVRES